MPRRFFKPMVHEVESNSLPENDNGYRRRYRYNRYRIRRNVQGLVSSLNEETEETGNTLNNNVYYEQNIHRERMLKRQRRQAEWDAEPAEPTTGEGGPAGKGRGGFKEAAAKVGAFFNKMAKVNKEKKKIHLLNKEFE